MDALLYFTVWISLSLFAVAEVARDRTVSSWPRATSATGLALMIVHILIAMGTRHGWQHASALVATADQTYAVYGVAWGWGVYVNYAFTVAWGITLIPWFQGASAPEFRVRMARILFVVVIANAAIVFAAGWRRGMGVAIVGLLLYAWRRPRAIGSHAGA